MKEEEIQLYNTYNETKASVVERVIRTLKTRMWRYFTAKKTMRYIDVLPDLVDSYNRSKHRSIQKKPINVTQNIEQEVWHTLYGKRENKGNIKYKFDVGDQVRISKMKRTFEKGYPSNILRSRIAFTHSGVNGKGGRMKKYYSTYREYIKSINESLRESPDINNDEIKFDIQNRKVTITLSPGYKVQLRREQAIVLGFMKFEDSTEVKEIANTETGEYEANLHRETNIHVYCDIVQPQIVGDKTQSLLAIVPSEKTTGTYETVYAVENIHYIPVQTKSFQEVGILLRSSTNESIPFEYGRATITLHLKPLNYFQ